MFGWHFCSERLSWWKSGEEWRSNRAVTENTMQNACTRPWDNKPRKSIVFTDGSPISHVYIHRKVFNDDTSRTNGPHRKSIYFAAIFSVLFRNGMHATNISWKKVFLNLLELNGAGEMSSYDFTTILFSRDMRSALVAPEYVWTAFMR